MRFLLLSNSTNPGEAFLEWSQSDIQKFLGSTSGVIAFVPFAALTFSFDEYEQKVSSKFASLGYHVQSVHHQANPVAFIKAADAIVIGGGNTFHLLYHLQKYGLLEAIRARVLSGVPFVGWSAGSNIACPTICTTNDMPIVEPQNFKALGLVPFQINPHYTDQVISGHGGETRDQRIAEYLVANPLQTVVGLREGTSFLYADDNLQLLGNKTVKVFRYNAPSLEIFAPSDFNFLMKS